VAQTSERLASHGNTSPTDAFFSLKCLYAFSAIPARCLVELHVDTGQTRTDNPGTVADRPLDGLFVFPGTDANPSLGVALRGSSSSTIGDAHRHRRGPVEGRKDVLLECLHLSEESRIDALGTSLRYLEEVGQGLK